MRQFFGNQFPGNKPTGDQGQGKNEVVLKTAKANIGMKWQFKRNPTQVDVNDLRDREIPGVI